MARHALRAFFGYISMAQDKKADSGNDGDVEDIKKALLEDPKIAENLGLLEEIGVLSHIDGLVDMIRNYKALFVKGLEVFHCDSIDDILETTVRQLSDLYLPSFIAFAWKPVQSHVDITLRTYRDYEIVNMELELDNIAMFESFFSKYPKPVSFADMEERLKNSEDIDQMRKVQPEIVAPIIGPFALSGIILIGRKTSGSDYTDDEMMFLQKFMFFVSQAIKNHLYYEHSLRDIKTGLYNHGFFMTRVKEEIASTKRNYCSSSIIMIDVDRFKSFNDAYGHLAGDQVLENLAQVIRQNVRTYDIPSRFGGEEFTVLLPNAEPDTAWLVAERLRLSVEEMEITWETPLPSITISLGVFSFDQDSDLKTNDIIHRADEALYVSKARGRNCTTLWKPDLLDNISNKT